MDTHKMPSPTTVYEGRCSDRPQTHYKPNGTDRPYHYETNNAMEGGRDNAQQTQYFVQASQLCGSRTLWYEVL